MVEEGLGGGEAAFELEVVGGVEEVADVGAGGEAEVEEVAAGDPAGGEDGFVLVGLAGVLEEVVGVEGAVAGEAVEAVKFEGEGEVGVADDAAEGVFSHAGGVDEAHVMGDEVDDAVDEGAGEFEAGEDGFGDAGAEFGVAVEADAGAAAAVGAEGGGGGFSDVVEEDGVGEDGVGLGEAVEHEEGVGVDVAFGVEFGGLLDALEGGDFGEDEGEEAGLVEEVDGVSGAMAGFAKDAGEFVLDAFDADELDAGGVGLDGGEGIGVKGEVEDGGEADGADHAEGIFVETLGGVADGADDF